MLVAAACPSVENAQQLVAVGVVPMVLAISQEPSSGLAAAATAAVEALCRAVSAARLWCYGQLPMGAFVQDSFYAVPSDIPFGALDHFRGAPPAPAGQEVLLVNFTDDARLTELAAEAAAATKGLDAAAAASALATLLPPLAAFLLLVPHEEDDDRLRLPPRPRGRPRPWRSNGVRVSTGGTGGTGGTDRCQRWGSGTQAQESACPSAHTSSAGLAAGKMRRRGGGRCWR